MSGHPLDHYKFEMKHYGITPIADFNEFKEAINMQSNPNRMFRLIGLVAEAQHKISRQGNKYGNFIIEDYSGKTDCYIVQRRLYEIHSHACNRAVLFSLPVFSNNDTTGMNLNSKC